jgi:hypothetical protein
VADDPLPQPEWHSSAVKPSTRLACGVPSAATTTSRKSNSNPQCTVGCQRARRCRRCSRSQGTKSSGPLRRPLAAASRYERACVRAPGRCSLRTTSGSAAPLPRRSRKARNSAQRRCSSVRPACARRRRVLASPPRRGAMPASAVWREPGARAERFQRDRRGHLLSATSS